MSSRPRPGDADPNRPGHALKPKLASYRFDQGYWHLDQWHADGKPHLSHTVLARLRATKVLLLAVAAPIGVFVADWNTPRVHGRRFLGEDDDHCFSAVARPVHERWRELTAFDAHELRKARSVTWPGDPLTRFVDWAIRFSRPPES